MDTEKSSPAVSLSENLQTVNNVDEAGAETYKDELIAVPEKIVKIKQQPYKKKSYFFSVAELKFFEVLKEILGNNYYIFPKVRICDIVDRKDKKDYSQFNRIKSKHVDFLICTKNPITSKLVIELDDSSHNHQTRIDRDNFVDDVFASSGIPIAHIKVRNYYNKDLLIKELQRAYKTKYEFIGGNSSQSNKPKSGGCSMVLVLFVLSLSVIFLNLYL
jgi:very-short-patch-repair endonuclease